MDLISTQHMQLTNNVKLVELKWTTLEKIYFEIYVAAFSLVLILTEVS